MSNDDMIYICTFPNRYAANLVMSFMHEIVSDYGWATMADLKDMSGITSTYNDTTKGWSLNALDNAVIKKCKYSYELYMPQFDRFKDAMDDCDCSACEECNEYDDDEYDYGREPVNLSVPFECYLEHPEVIDHAIQALFKVPEKLEGRPVFISIT